MLNITAEEKARTRLTSERAHCPNMISWSVCDTGASDAVWSVLKESIVERLDKALREMKKKKQIRTLGNYQ